MDCFNLIQYENIEVGYLTRGLTQIFHTVDNTVPLYPNFRFFSEVFLLHYTGIAALVNCLLKVNLWNHVVPLYGGGQPGRLDIVKLLAPWDTREPDFEPRLVQQPVGLHHAFTLVVDKRGSKKKMC